MSLNFSRIPKSLEDLAEDFQANHTTKEFTLKIKCHCQPGEEPTAEEVKDLAHRMLNHFADLGFVTIEEVS